MALFSISRYSGENDDANELTFNKSNKNLLELQQKAKSLKIDDGIPPKKKRRKIKNNVDSNKKVQNKNNCVEINQSQEALLNDETLPSNTLDIQLLGDMEDITIGSEKNLNENEKKAISTFGNFSALGEEKHYESKKVFRKLPDWLAKPFVIKDVVTSISRPILEEIPNINPILSKNLEAFGVTNLFPVQRCVIPSILNSGGYGVCKFPPRDICVSAPTGSGKTIAFALPIVQLLMDRVKAITRALVVLPTRELASQVFSIFVSLCNHTSLRCVLLIGGKMSLEQEQKTLFKTFQNGERFQADIVIATPGRLVEHLNETQEFNLDQLRFLVIDEADRMMDQIQQDWLSILERNVFRNRTQTIQLTIKSMQTPRIPLQKLLFSATLSADPEKLEQLNLFQPRLFTALSKPLRVTQNNENAEASEGHEFIGKYTTPTGLKEYMVVCTAGEKPMAIIHLVKNLKKVLCFAGSVETAQRLAVLLQLYMQEIDVQDRLICAEFSSNLTSAKRKRTLKEFTAGKINVLVCSDAMARGIDVPNVSDVILYDTPSLIKTYIHRVGRTARAGEVGNAYTLLKADEIYHFKKMVREAGKMNVKKKRINEKEYDEITPNYEKVLSLISDKLREIKNAS